MMRLGRDVAIVTGGARGIGRAVAERFGEEGASVGVLDVDQEGAMATAMALAERHVRAAGIPADVADSIAVRCAMERVARELGSPTILVNNAGIGGLVALGADGAEATWRRVLDVNLTGAYLCARHAVPYMRQAGRGVIINIASTRALMSEADGEPYAASKGGLLALTHAPSVSLGPSRIRVNAISPGWIYTHGEALRPEDHARHPVGRVGQPNDIAEACVFLASWTESGFVTGQNFVVHGGMTVKMIYV